LANAFIAFACSGNIFCGGCSSKKLALPKMGFDKEQRVCDVGVELDKQCTRSMLEYIM